MAEATPMRSVPAVLGSRNEATRRHNLSVLLTLVHRSAGMSRAELTRATGLNRSTVGALVSDLVGHGLVMETEPVTSSVGRPSPVVRPSADVAAVAVIPDVDAVVVGLVGLGGHVLVRRRIALDAAPQPADVARLAADAVASLVRERPGLRVMGAGVAVPGIVRSADAVVTRAPHLLWEHRSIGLDVSEALGLPTAVDNDANAGLIAQTSFGAGRGVDDVIYLNGSTSGIGGGVLVGGVVLRGADGYAGELGHTLVTADGLPCHCGRRGCLETEVNLQLLEEAAGDAGLDHADLDAALATHRGRDLEDEVSRQVEVLARAIASLVSVFNPRSVVLGGFLGSLFSLRTDALRDTVRATTFAPLADHLSIGRAELGDNVVLVGAAELAFGAVLADPLAAPGASGAA